jgi:hypothetical protein
MHLAGRGVLHDRDLKLQLPGSRMLQRRSRASARRGRRTQPGLELAASREQGAAEKKPRTWPEGVSRTTGKPLWRESRSTWRTSSMRMCSRRVTTGAAIAARTGTRSSAFLAEGVLGSHGTHFTCACTTRGLGGCRGTYALVLNYAVFPSGMRFVIEYKSG